MIESPCPDIPRLITPLLGARLDRRGYSGDVAYWDSRNRKN